MGVIISSFSNPFIKRIRKLRDRKFREETGLFYVEGIKFVGEAFEEGWEIAQVVYAAPLVKSDFGKKFLELSNTNNFEMIEVIPKVFQTISMKDGPQGIGAIIRRKKHSLYSLALGQNDLWIALDAVQDPGNLGTIMRTSDCTGARGIILLDHATDATDPAAIRASMGAFFSQTIIECSLDEFKNWKRKNKITVVGTSGNSNIDYHTYQYSFPMILLMGSERQGLTEEHLKTCDAVVRIPMVGKSDSLNLAIATGVILYEIFNQRRDLS